MLTLLSYSFAGAQSVRMSWGSAQEAATLYGLMHALPKSKLLEAGLFRLNEASLPKSWCFKKGELPPLGASPDGMLFHPEGICQPSDIEGPISDFEVRKKHSVQICLWIA